MMECGLSVGVMLAAQLVISFSLAAEVRVMKKIMSTTFVVAGTALLGRPGMACFLNYGRALLRTYSIAVEIWE